MLKLTGTDIRIAQLLEENARLSNTASVHCRDTDSR